tara:strand:- start:10887 stop:11135 length:249 start_codon:yes stop_codon:yes gene_type:complete
MDIKKIWLTMKTIYDIILENWLILLLTVMFLWVSMIAFDKPEPDKTIIQIEIDLDQIDKSLTSIEETIDEIFGKIEVQLNEE